MQTIPFPCMVREPRTRQDLMERLMDAEVCLVRDLGLYNVSEGTSHPSHTWPDIPESQPGPLSPPPSHHLRVSSVLLIPLGHTSKNHTNTRQCHRWRLPRSKPCNVEATVLNATQLLRPGLQLGQIKHGCVSFTQLSQLRSRLLMVRPAEEQTDSIHLWPTAR